MMLRVLLALFIGVHVYGAATFITKEEYAASLYHNHRAHECHTCHGESGEGRRIAEFNDKGAKKALGGKQLNQITL